MALHAWNHLATGMGGIDWAGLDAVAVLLDIHDDKLELMLHLLAVIKRHKPPEQARGH